MLQFSMKLFAMIIYIYKQMKSTVPVKAVLMISVMGFVVAEAKKIARCNMPEVVNAEVKCSSQESAGKFVDATYCKIYCYENHEYVSGPKAIDCYKGSWLHAGEGNVFYSSPTRCKRISTGDGRSARIAPPVQHDGMCSTVFCERRYYGVTKRICKGYGCCWDTTKKDCFQFLKAQCQIAIAERTKCSGTWYGIPKRLCHSKGCCFDGDMSTCYTAKPADVDESVKPKAGPKVQPGTVSACANLENSLPNGRIDCKESNGMLTCSAYCDKRYVLEGVKTRSCHITSQEPGSWKCRREYCDDIKTLPTTFVDCTSGSRIGSTCTASCAQGFKLFNPSKNRATCLQIGEWSNPTFWQCREIQCPELTTNDIVEEGEAPFLKSQVSISCTKGRLFGSVCAANCQLGFVPVGVSSIRCSIEGEWTRGSFKCIPLSCPPPIVPRDAYFICTNEYKVGTSCSFKCTAGYKVRGPQSTTCRANQRWSFDPSQIECVVSRECEDPFVPEGAQLECTAGNSIGTLCSLKCPPGKLLRGYNVNVLACMDNLTWQLSFDGESCEGPRRCGDLRTVYPEAAWDKLNVVCSGGDRLGSVCTVDCGVDGDGSTVTVCTYNAEEALAWTNPPPLKCIDVTTKPCDLEIDLSSGKVSGQTNSKYVKSVVVPALPLWQRWSGGKHDCEYQSVIEIHYENLTGISLRMKYEVPSSVHFELSESKKSPAKTITGKNFHLNGINRYSVRGVFQSRSDITFVLKKSTVSVNYKIGLAEEKTIPVDFNSSPVLVIGLNRAVEIRHDYDISRMGSGMCSFCLAYSDI